MTESLRRPILIVGSVPLDNATEVFLTLAEKIGGHVHCLPDGETGPRLDWVLWQHHVFQRHPAFETVERPAQRVDPRNPTGVNSKTIDMRYNRLKTGVDAATIELGRLGYAEGAAGSYRDFARLKSQGLIAAKCRFMMPIPTPYNVVDSTIWPEDRRVIEPVYERHLMREVEEIVDSIPSADLAIQWDVAHEVQNLAGGRPIWLDDGFDGVIIDP